MGHSAGGQLMGLAPGAQHLKALVTVTAGSAYWKHWHGLPRLAMWLLWHAVMPGLTRVLGYFPGRALGLGENLPPGVAWQWMRWARNPDYLFGDSTLELERYRRIRAPLLALSFSDDGCMPEAAVRSLLRHFPAARVEHRHLTPAEVGHGVGHLGFFQEKSRDTLWPRVTGWLRRHAAI